MSNKFEDILNTSLERLSGGEDPEAILRAYPEHAAKLRPLLTAAGVLSSTLKPEVECPARGLSQFRRAAILAQGETRKRRFICMGIWKRSWVMAACIALAVIIAVGTTGFAAAGSMPDQSLYPVKIATENIQSAVTPSTMGKAKLQAKLAKKRIDELEYVIDKDDTKLAEEVSNRLYAHYHKIESLLRDRDNGYQPQPDETPTPPAAPAPKLKPTPKPRAKVANARPTSGQIARELAELRKMLDENDPKQTAVMRKVEIQEQQKAARAARAKMRRALEQSLREYRQAMSAIEEE